MRGASIIKVLLFVPSLIATSCGDDEADLPGACDTASCSAQCEALAGAGCDTLERSCQERILAAVNCVRGTPGELPDVRVLTLEEYEAQWEPGDDAGVDESLQDDAGVVTSADAQQQAARRHWSDALELLGLLAADTTTTEAHRESSIDNLGGYYRSVHRRITLIDRGEPQDSPSAQILFAHELVHALQDQQLGLSGLRERTSDASDASLAYRCLIEGEAQLYAKLAWGLLNGLSVDPRNFEIQEQRFLKYSRSDVLRAPSPYAATQWLVYPVGEAFLTDAWLGGGRWAVQSLYDAPPSTSVFWMRGYEDQRERANSLQSLIEPLACNAAEPPTSEHALVSRTSLGALHAFAMIGTAMRDDGIYPAEEAWGYAQRWRMDSIAVFAGPDGDTAVSWRIRFDDADVVERIAAAVDGRVDAGWLPVKLRAQGRELELLAAEDGEVLEAWSGTDPEGCPPPEDEL